MLLCVNLQKKYFSAKELAENSHVQDAFVIAVEQQAKERLERLSALRKIKPVDMTKLSQQVGGNLGGNQVWRRGWEAVFLSARYRGPFTRLLDLFRLVFSLGKCL